MVQDDLSDNLASTAPVVPIKDFTIDDEHTRETNALTPQQNHVKVTRFAKLKSLAPGSLIPSAGSNRLVLHAILPSRMPRVVVIFS